MIDVMTRITMIAVIQRLVDSIEDVVSFRPKDLDTPEFKYYKPFSDFQLR